MPDTENTCIVQREDCCCGLLFAALNMGTIEKTLPPIGSLDSASWNVPGCCDKRYGIGCYVLMNISWCPWCGMHL